MGWVANASPAVNAQSQWPTIITICAVLSTFSVAIVTSRVIIRARARGLATDDYLAALSMIFALAYSALCIVQTKYGLGLPIKARPPENLIPYTRVNFAGRPIYQMGISFFKVALCVSYLRLLKRTDQKVYRAIVWVTITLVMLGHLGCTLSLIFACHPVSKSWNPRQKGHCLAPGPSFTGYAAVTITSDIVVAILPIPVLLKLNVRRSKKIGLIGIFLLGLFTTVCSILRYSQINRIQHGDGNSTMLVLWGTIEFNVGNMVSSLPFLAPVFLRKAKEYRSKNSYNNGSGGDDSRGSNRAKNEAIRLSDRTDNDNDEYPSSSSGGGSGGGSKKGKAKKMDGFGRALATASATEENLFRQQHHPSNSIVKSVTYSIRVDDKTSGDSPV